MSTVMASEKPIMRKTYFGPFEDNINFNFGKLHIRLNPTTSSMDWWCRERSVIAVSDRSIKHMHQMNIGWVIILTASGVHLDK